MVRVRSRLRRHRQALALIGEVAGEVVVDFWAPHRGAGCCARPSGCGTRRYGWDSSPMRSFLVVRVAGPRGQPRSLKRAGPGDVRGRLLRTRR